MKKKCPNCWKESIFQTLVFVKKSPLLNNVVYKTKTEALKSPVGSNQLVQCLFCNFVFNCIFKDELICYNEYYNSDRSYSKVYNTYVSELSVKISSHIKEAGTILEVGCGNGDFLYRICSEKPVFGVGIDNAYCGKYSNSRKLMFFKKHVDFQDFSKPFSVILMRHVLEHIPQPFLFVKNAVESNSVAEGTRIWIEVPDLRWILKNKTFFDITYEHCNYFSKESLTYLLLSLGFEIKSVENIYDQQYLLAHAIYGGVKKPIQNSRYPSLGDAFKDLLNRKTQISELITKNKNMCIWGGSGKGVLLLSHLTQKIRNKIKCVIDINHDKQGKYLPYSGMRIHPPESLLAFQKVNIPILIMNDIYQSEIEMKLRELKVQFKVYSV